MTPDYTVERFGKDSSGRDIYMTRHAWAVWKAVLARLPFGDKVVIVQGAFMSRNGGGASASAGYHDQAGCWDIRTWNLTSGEIEALIRELRKAGIAAWRRDRRHGMDPHIHTVFGDDFPKASGAVVQWNQYVLGQNGLASRGRDYEWRPSPLVLKPPADLLEDDMASPEVQAQLDRLEASITEFNRQFTKFRQGEVGRDKEERRVDRERYVALKKRLAALVDQGNVSRDEIVALLTDTTNEEETQS